MSNSHVPLVAKTDGGEGHDKCLVPQAEVWTAVALGWSGGRIGSRFEGEKSGEQVFAWSVWRQEEG
jgi:hypothetical protein